MRNHETLGKPGAYEIIELVSRNINMTEPLIADRLGDILTPKETKRLIKELISIAFIRCVPRLQHIELTEVGREALLLAKVINGANLDSVVNQLSKLQASNFSLITQDICGCFLDLLKNRHDVEDIYICSPWIRLSDEYLSDLENIIRKAHDKVSFHIITRPPAELIVGPAAWRIQILKTLLWFKQHHGELFKLKRLHTKLYCAAGNNWQTAIFGSENLTEAGNVELGIRIDDERMTQKLLNYFNRMYNNSIEISREELYVKN